jgi:hypothetical protein
MCFGTHVLSSQSSTRMPNTPENKLFDNIAQRLRRRRDAASALKRCLALINGILHKRRFSPLKRVGISVR